MGSFGTGTPPGAHGLVGYEVLDPDRDLVFNELSWENGPDPFRGSPRRPCSRRSLLDGVEVTRIGPGFFDGSGLTNAALRGGRFRAASSLADRVAAAVDAVTRARRGRSSTCTGVRSTRSGTSTGRRRGSGSTSSSRSTGTSPRWRPASRPAPRSRHGRPRDGRRTVRRTVWTWRRSRSSGRGPALRVGAPRDPAAPVSRTGAATRSSQRWQDRLADRAWVGTRDELVDDGWFGAVRPEVLARIGDVLAVDARRRRGRRLGPDATRAGTPARPPRVGHRRGARPYRSSRFRPGPPSHPTRFCSLRYLRRGPQLE